MEGPNKTDSSCQTLTSSNPPFSNPNSYIVDNTNDLEHLKQLNDSFIPQISTDNHKKFKETLHQFKKVDVFNKTSIKDISIDEIINELENDVTVNSNQRKISCENID